MKRKFLSFIVIFQAFVAILLSPNLVSATPFTMTVPATGVALPTEYPQAGGVAIVMTGANGNIYYQFSDPTGAFVGYQYSGTPTSFRGQPFTINSPIALDCGFRSCTNYFGGSIARIDVRFTAYDGDTQVGGFDYNRISLIMNGTSVGNWSNRDTQVTNNSGTSAIGSNNGIVNGFGNNTLNTGWFSSTDATLLGNILSTGRTTTQVSDQTPNDNYWDFRQGSSLPSETLRTIAPGYELEKTRDIADLTYATVGQVINYKYVVRNIGSVDISNLSVVDDKITAPNTVSCDKTFLAKTASNGTPREALCTASYVVTQADIDRGTLTNIARATGTPQYGSLGTLRSTVTLTGPTFNNGMTLDKVASPRTFSTLNQAITYTFTVTNTGNTTLKNIVVTDPKIPTLSCSIAELKPLSSENTVNTASCQAIYNVTQTDINNADQGIALVNTASATGRDPKNVSLTVTDQDTITGPNLVPAMSVEKVASPLTYSAVGDVINYQIKVKNTGIMTWPTAPTVVDPLTGGAVCPAGSVAPGATVICTASYTITQPNLDDETVLNTATATVTVNGDTVSGSADATVTAVATPSLSIAKALKAGSPDPFTATTDRLVYTYTVKNTGNVLIKDIALVDDKVALSCPVTELVAGASTVCESSEYAVTLADLNAGFVTNNVTADANTKLGNPVAQKTATLTVTADQNPAMDLVKTAETIDAADFLPDNTVDYTYTITNTGNVTLTQAITIVDDKFSNAITCPAGAVVPGGQVVCNATYTITVADVVAGLVTNTAYAQSGTTVSGESQATIPQEGTIALSLNKQAATSAFVANPSATFASTGDTLYYLFTVTNTGDVAFTTGGGAGTDEIVSINDPLISSVTCNQPSLIYPVSSGLSPSSMTCTGTYAGLTQADIDAGKFTNTANATVTYEDGPSTKTVVSADSTVTVPTNITPSFAFTKSPPAPAEFTTLGQSVPFTFAVTNTSAQTIANVTVTDPAIPTLNCTLTDIGPAGSATATKSCTGNYQILQADMDAGTFTNVATATGVSATGKTIPAVTDDATVTLPATSRSESLSLDKMASTSAFAAVGDEIDYVFAVTNTGNVTLKNITVTDTPLGFSCTIPSLAVGATNTTACNATKVITQAEIDAGTFANSATATTVGGASGADIETATGPIRDPKFTFVKSSGDTFDSVGDVVTFDFAVQNTGNVTLTDVTVTDTFFNPALSCLIGSLAPNQIDNTTCSASHTISQQDLDNGSITNTASTSANGPQGPLAPLPSTAVVTAEPEVASYVVEKVEAAGNTTFGAVGSVTNYTFTITNTGLVTLKNLTISDPLTGLSCTVADLSPAASTTECANGDPFASSYTIQQFDIDAGALTNIVTVDATTTQGTILSETDQVTLTGPSQAPELTLLKSATSGAGFSAIGQTVGYSYVVTNSGNITLTAPITIADDRATVTCPALPAGGLAPMAFITCTATDTVDQADLDAGQVTNVATANISQPVVPSTLHPTGTAAVASNEDTVTVLGTQTPSLGILKRVQSGSSSTYEALSDEIVFEFVVTNTGNVTTTDPITVNDTVLGQSFECGPATGGIAPGGSAICEISWSPEQNDIDLGSFTNSATASMPYGAGTVATDPLTPATVTVSAVQKPEMTVEKTYRDGSLAAFTVGATAIYDYVITNTGNQTLVQPIEIEDNLISTITCPVPAVDLAPQASISCEGSYTVGVTDVQLGSTLNVARGVSPTVVSEPTSELIPADGVPALSITKVADVATFTQAGDKIVYTYTATNTSTGSPAPGFANPIYIEDNKFASPILCWESISAPNPNPDPDVVPGETITCTAEYIVTQADMDAIRTDASGATVSSFVQNTANGKTEFLGVDENGIPATTPVDVVSAPVTVRVDGARDASLLVEKTASGPNTPALVGDTVTFAITVTNDGTQTVSGIAVSDPMLSGLACTRDGLAVTGAFRLAPTKTAICTGTYVVLQSDIDAQELENTASATGTNPAGEPVTATGTTTYPVDPIAADVAITKTLASGSPAAAFAAVGEDITYLISVENTGNVTLSSTIVTDILFPGQSCEITNLAPLATDNSTCVFTYRVLQSDIDAGSITNTAKAVGQPATPGSDTVEDTDTLVGTGPEREPAVGVGKAANLSDFNAAGVPIVYTYTISNLGNITLPVAPAISDDKIVAPNEVTCAAWPANGLAPTQSVTCTATYLTTQDDVDAGFVTNIVDVSLPNPLGGADLTGQADLTIDSLRTPALSLSKLADDTTQVVAGQTITYTYIVKNEGNTRLTNVTLSDVQTHAGGTTALTIADNVIAVLEPGASATRTATYLVTQADIDAGVDLSNTAQADATAPSGATAPTPATADETVSVATSAPAIEAVKTAAALGPNPQVGTAVNFTITVENIGNVTLSTITLLDTLKRADNTAITPNPAPVYASGDGGQAGKLDVGETWTYTVKHALTQADIDAGGIVNSVRATGTSPTGPTVFDVSNNQAGAGATPTVVRIPSLPAIETTKRITATPTTLGATVRFEIDVKNTGNVTLTGVTATDTLTRADTTPLTLTAGPSFFRSDLGSSAGRLKVGETATYRASYILTQADIDAGGISNSASSTGSPPTGSPVTDTTDANVSLPITANPSIGIAKSLKSGGPTFDTVGDLLTYAFEVTNTGNVTITDQVRVLDPLITDAGGTITCPAPPLAPLANMTCEGTYAVTQADIDAGSVVNIARATAGTLRSGNATETVPAVQKPEMTTVKTGATITVDGTVHTDLKSEYFVAGAIVGYTYDVTNTGNVTLTDPITVADNRIATVVCPALPVGGLAPLQTHRCSANYTVTATDVRLTSVTNAATATSGTVKSPLVTETVPADGIPLLTINKALKKVNNPDGSPVPTNAFDEIGDVLTYEFTVTNDGTISFVEDVVVVDERLSGPLVCFRSKASDRDLRPKESVTCEGTYTVTQDDLDAGEVYNEAIAQTLFGPDDVPVISDPDTQTTPANAQPELNITKSASPLPITRVGQRLTYTLTLSNDGNQTLTNVRATDPLIPSLKCSIAEMAPQAVETCSGIYTVKQSDIDAGTLVNRAAVSGVTPDGKSVNDTTSLTLPVPAAAPDLAMTKVGSPDPFGAVGSAVTYVFTLENKGNVTLYDLVVTDEIVTPSYRCTIAQLNVGETDDSCSLSYTVTQDDVDAGEIINVASATGRDPFGPITQVSATSDVKSQLATPSLEATKTASLGGTIDGSIVTFDLFVRNTGDVTLSSLGITDVMDRRDGTQTALTTPFAYVSGDRNDDGKLGVTEIWRYRGAKVIDQLDIDAGGFNNSVVVNATDPFGKTVLDVSDDGDDLDGNTTNDVTEVLIVQGPALNVFKTVTTDGSAAGDDIVFQISATNVGNVTLTDITLVDEMRNAAGTDVTADITAITQTAPTGGATDMAPNDVWTWDVTYTLTQADVDAGGLVNTASVTGTPPTGPEISDRSDNGVDDDGNTTDDETTLLIRSAPAFEVVKTVVPRVDETVPVQAGEVVTFEIAVSNKGNVTLSELVLDDTMTNSDGTVLVPDSITLTQGASETAVQVGETLIFTVAYTLTQDDIDTGGIANTATASVVAPSGNPLVDVSDDGDDTDGNVLDDPTLFAITEFSSMEATKTADIPVRIGSDLFEVVFTITVTNTGNVSQRNLSIEDDLAPFVTPASLSGAPTAIVSGFDGAGGANPRYNGTSDINLVTTDVHILPGQTGTIVLTVTYDTTGNKHPLGLNTVVAKSDRIATGVSAQVGVVTSAEPDIIAIKSATPSNVMLGTTVTYTITFENRLATAESNLTIIDDLPAGVVYTPDTARFNGMATPQPTLSGRQLRWSGISLAPRETVSVTFNARVVGELGEIVNSAYMLDADGNVVSNVATATVTRSPEAVFECSDIIGKVFDDRNMNGYQDGAVEPDNSAVTNQDYAGGKGKLAPVPDVDAGSPFEPGLPNVRLSTVNGTLITTDEYGRFSVPCAELPAGIGSNFILKLDERTLPTGYRVTTENPRVVRVTAGTVTKLNFGAAIANVVDIDLMASAFQTGTASPTAALVAGIDQLVRHLSDVPSVLRLSYYMNGEAREVARARLDSVEELVRNRWRESGRYRLLIERTIQQLQ